MLKFFWNRKVSKDNCKDKDIIDGESLLDQVSREEFYRFF